MKLFRLVLIFPLLGCLISLNAQGLLTKQAPLPCLNKNFTIVVHLVQDEDDETNVTQQQIEDLVDTLNVDFAPICVGFEVCAINEIENYQYDSLAMTEWDEMQVVYHQQKRINVFFVSAYDQDISNEPCVFATQNGITQLELGGIVIKKEACLESISRNLSHGMGHYFGLTHTFDQPMGTQQELVDGSNCATTGDLLCDTPADPFVIGNDPEAYVSVDDGCRFINFVQDLNGEYYKPDVGNIMALYQDECRCGFTHGQYIKMAANCESAMW